MLVTSNVPGAAVSVGEVTFETRTDAATEVRSLPVGKYQVRARLSGYKEWTGQVEIVQDGRSEVQISMEPLSPPPPPRAEPPQKPAPDSQKPGSSAPRRTMPSF